MLGGLALVTIFIGSRIGIDLPKVGGRITVADTLVFLTLVVYGGEAAVLLATTETVFNSLRICKNYLTTVFNAGMMALATSITAHALGLVFGPSLNLQYDKLSNTFVIAVCFMALTQYICNSGFVAVVAALKTGQPVWETWKKFYLWTSITYIVGATVAVTIARALPLIGLYGVAATVPIISIIYLTYQSYLKNIVASEEKTQQAQRHVEELSRYIAEQERIREQYAQVEKLSALGQLSSGVAHDFNNTLASILGRAELMLKYTDNPKMRRGLEVIITSAQDGAKTVKRIQDFARQRRDQDFVPVDVDKILLDVSEITRARWKDSAEAANIHINLELQNRSGVTVKGDASELRDVLVNMVFNAVDAMPEGGTLTLGAEVSGESVLISVSDTGKGMSQEVRLRVFDPFFTTKGVKGMGLGLSVSYGIIRRHEGEIQVESEVGRGTTFRILLPIASVAASEGGEIECASATAWHRRKEMTKFLVVDDESRVRQLLCEILEDEGFDPVPAEEGREALALFEGGGFDAVFTDVGMPGMSGWELARAIRDQNQEIPIAVITGWGEAVSSLEKEGAQVDWVLTKPFSMAQIAEISQEVSARAKARREQGSVALVA